MQLFRSVYFTLPGAPPVGAVQERRRRRKGVTSSDPRGLLHAVTARLLCRPPPAPRCGSFDSLSALIAIGFLIVW